MFEGDIRIRMGYVWTSGVVPYAIVSEHFTEDELRSIKDNIKYLNDELNPYITFVEKMSGALDFISIQAEPGKGCWSYVGKIGGLQEINIDCARSSRSVLAHEVMHALGFWHEQNRPDRDDYIKINYENMVDGASGQFTKRTQQDSFGYAYDYGSVMHYGSKAFSKNGKDVLESTNPVGMTLGNKVGLTSVDRGKLLMKYGAAPTTAPTTAPATCSVYKRKRGCKRRRRRCKWSGKKCINAT